jgi:hypothetical protein
LPHPFAADFPNFRKLLAMQTVISNLFCRVMTVFLNGGRAQIVEHTERKRS